MKKGLIQWMHQTFPFIMSMFTSEGRNDPHRTYRIPSKKVHIRR